MLTRIKLGDVLDVKRGTSLAGEYYSTSGDKIRLTLGNFQYPNGGFKDNTSKSNIYFIGDVKSDFILKKGDIITPLTEQVAGLLGETARIPEDNLYILSGDVGLVIPDESKLNKIFAYYLVSSPIVKKQLGSSAQQTKIRHTSPDKIKDCIVWIPDLVSQKKIGELIDTLNNKISSNNAINAELEALAKTIYDYWFLQFEFPNEEGLPYKSSGGRMVWSEELKREIPEGWGVGTLSHFIKEIKGGDWGKDVPEGNYTKRVTCIRGADIPSITGNSVLSAPIRYILEKNISKKLDAGNLIVEISGGSPTQSTGRIAYINDILKECFKTEIITSNFCKAISLQDDDFLYWFYITWSKLYDSGILFKYEGKTTGIKNLLYDFFIEDYQIVIPEDTLIIKYQNYVSQLFNKVQQNKRENQELAALRDWLLPMLMNGQVGFKEQER